MRVALLGASGAMGRRAASELARSPEVEHLTLAGRRVEELAEIVDAMGRAGRSASHHAFDIQDEPALRQAIEGSSVVVSCAGPGYLLEAASVRACIAAGVPYVSLSDDAEATEEIVELDRAAADAGVTIVSGAGLSPGLTNLLVVLASGRLDEVHEIEIAVAVAAGETDGEASTLHVLSKFSRAPLVVSDGTISEDIGGTRPRLVYFPEPVGWVETFVCAHPEIITLGRDIGGDVDISFRFGLLERALMDALRAVTASGLARPLDRRRLVARASKPLKNVLQQFPPRPARWSAARVDVHGRAEGTETTVSMGVVDHLPSLATVPLTQVALDLGSGHLHSPGVHALDRVRDAGPFLAALSDRGVRIAGLEPERV